MGISIVVDSGTGDDRSRSSTRRTWRYLPLGLAVALAGALSLPRLGVRTMWLDETLTVGATSELLTTWRRTGGTQALYYLLVWPVAQVSTEPWALRLPSAVFALATVAVVHVIGRRIGGPRVGALAAGGLALSWGLARYAMEARSYTLALLLVSVGWLALVTLVQRGDPTDRGRWWWAFVGATLLAPLAHGLSVLHVAAQLAALVVAPHGSRWLRRLVPVLVALGVEMAFLFAVGAGDVGDWVSPLSLGQIRGITQLLLGNPVTAAVLATSAAWATADAVSRFWRARHTREANVDTEATVEAWSRLVPVFWALGLPLLLVTISLVRPYAVPRYAFSALPGVFLLIAGLIARLRSPARLAAASLVLAALLVIDQPKATALGGEDWQNLTACIAANAADGDLVHARQRSPVDYHWPRATGRESPAVSSLTADPLGEVARIYAGGDPMARLLAHTGPESVWYVDRVDQGRTVVAALAASDEIAARYTLTETWTFDGPLYLVRLDPVGGDRPARPAAACDTDPPPGG